MKIKCKCGAELPVTTSKKNLKCSCGSVVPSKGGILHFVNYQDDGFDLRWQKHPKPQATIGPMFWPKTEWERSYMEGKEVLDAGIGCGRFSQIVESCGGTPIGVDISLGGLTAARELCPSAILLRADLTNLPIVDNSIDIGFSIGVLHHTSDPELAFRQVASKIRPGGELAVWVYEQPVDDKYLPVLDFLHAITSNCPKDKLHEAFEQYAVEIRDIYNGAWGILEHILRISNSPDDEECISDSFDWHCPKYRYWHTNEELVAWFHDAGYSKSKVGSFPITVIGTKDAT